MAMNKKNTKKNKGTGFAGDPVGTVHPAGATIKKNPDGTVSIVTPKKKKK